MTDRTTYRQRREELVAHILAHPAEFQMQIFGVRTACGTTACIAGTAALLAQEQGLCTVDWHSEDEDGESHMVLSLITDKGVHEDIDLWARDYLGLPNSSLFHNMNLWTVELAADALLKARYVGDVISS